MPAVVRIMQMLYSLKGPPRLCDAFGGVGLDRTLLCSGIMDSSLEMHAFISVYQESRNNRHKIYGTNDCLADALYGFSSNIARIKLIASEASEYQCLGL